MKAIWNDIVVAESDNTEKVEGNHYFPPSDVNEDLLKDSDTDYTCPWKGDAAYFHLEKNGNELKDAVWSYPDPKEAANNIAGYYAFDTSKVQVTT